MSYNPTVIGLSQTIQTLTEVVRSLAAQKPLDSNERTQLADFAARLDALGDLETVTVDDIVSVMVGYPTYVVDMVTKLAESHRLLELVNTLNGLITTGSGTLADIANDADVIRITVANLLSQLNDMMSPGTLAYQIKKLSENIDMVVIGVAANCLASGAAVNLSSTALKSIISSVPVGCKMRLHVHLHEVFDDNAVISGSYYDVDLYANAVIMSRIYKGYCAVGNKFTEHDIITTIDISKEFYDGLAGADTLKIMFTDTTNGAKNHYFTGSVGFNLIMDDLVEERE